MVLNSLQPHPSDPTLLEAKFIILDFEVSRNNVLVTKEVALESLSKTIINKPIRGYYNEKEDDFGDHEAEIKEKDDGTLIFERNTVPMGVFVSEGYVESLNIDGEEKEVLVADAVLWKSQFQEAIGLIERLFEDGITIPMSCEYLYSNFVLEDGVEKHLSPIYFEAHALLGQNVIPAYESARLVTVEQLSEFNQLVAQAVNQIKEKEDVILEEKQEVQINEEVVEVNEEVVETVEVVEEVETVEEVNQEVELAQKFADLEEQFNILKSEKEALASKFNESTETIVSLNSKIEELLPYQQQALNAQREQKLTELTTKFEKAFNNAGAKEKFESEEVKTLLNEAVESSEAFLTLNTMVVDLITELQVKENTGTTMLGLNSIRQDLLPKTQDDDFDSIYSL